MENVLVVFFSGIIILWEELCGVCVLIFWFVLFWAVRIELSESALFIEGEGRLIKH